MRRTALSVVALVLLARAGSPQGTPLGPEFRVNTYTTDLQYYPSVSADDSGNFVLIWQSAQDPGRGVFGQRYSATGAPLGIEFHVNTYTTGLQGRSDVSSDTSGNFVVVWMSDSSGQPGIFGQRYASAGTPLGGEFQVNAGGGFPGFPSVSADSAGNFIVVWEQSQGTPNYCICGQRFSSSGAPLGPEFRVNTYTTGEQYDSSVAMDPAGNFVVVWRAVHDGSSNGVFGQRFAATGTPLGVEFRVNTYTTNNQDSPSVAIDASANFVVVWQSSSGQDGAGLGIFGQRFANSGAPIGAEFRINTYTTNSQSRPAVAADASGNFVVVWSSFQGGSTELFGQRYASSGVPLGPEFRVNATTVDLQTEGTVASTPLGNFVVAWSGVQLGSYDIFGQRFSQVVPVELIELTIE